MNTKLKILLAVCVSLVVVDQVTKYLAVSRLTTAPDDLQGAARVAGFLRERNLDNDPPVDGGRYRVAPPHRFIESYWHFRYVENPGAAWGLFAQLPEVARRGFFYAVTVGALYMLGSMYRKLRDDQRLLQFSIALICAGASGNFIDRLLRGYVIDFIDWHWRNRPNLHWPTFNVADAAISVGVSLVLLDSLRHRRAAESGANPALAGPPAPENP